MPLFSHDAALFVSFCFLLSVLTFKGDFIVRL